MKTGGEYVFSDDRGAYNGIPIRSEKYWVQLEHGHLGGSLGVSCPRPAPRPVPRSLIHEFFGAP